MLHARELIVTIASSLSLRFLAEQAAKAVPFGGDFVAGAIAGAATWSIGQVALEYYESGKQLKPARLRELYSSFYRRFRRDNTTNELYTRPVQTLEDNIPTPLLDEPKGKIAEEGTA
jgi:hypothetical protein